MTASGRARTRVGALALALAACGSPRRSEPLVGPPDIRTEAEARGQRVFHSFCHACHPGGAGGLGHPLNNKPIPELAMRTQVRKGFGDMPSFSEEALPDDALDDLVEFMEALRRTR